MSRNFPGSSVVDLQRDSSLWFMSRDFPGSSVADLQRDSTLWFMSRDFPGSSVVDLQRDSSLWFISGDFPGSSVVDLQRDSTLWFISRNFFTSKMMTTTRKEMMTAAMIPETSAAMLKESPCSSSALSAGTGRNRGKVKVFIIGIDWRVIGFIYSRLCINYLVSFSQDTSSGLLFFYMPCPHSGNLRLPSGYKLSPYRTENLRSSPLSVKTKLATKIMKISKRAFYHLNHQSFMGSRSFLPIDHLAHNTFKPYSGLVTRSLLTHGLFGQYQSYQIFRNIFQYSSRN